MKRALNGLDELKKHVDTNIVIPNQNLFKVASEKTTFEESFELSNRVLKHGVQSVTDLMVRPGLINLDFADVETVMSGMGKAMMGTGEAEGEKRASEAADHALKNPLIDEYSLKGAKGLLINITGGKDLTLFEVDEAVNRIRAEVDSEAELIIGAITDKELEGKMRVSIVATALDNQGPQIKPVVSMVHRIHNRNSGYSENVNKTLIATQPVLNATEGATALDLNVSTQQSAIKAEHEKTVETEKTEDMPIENISIENATYLNNLQNEEKTNETMEEIPNFEVDSIQLLNPQLFSDDQEVNSVNHSKEVSEKEINTNANQNSESIKIFENSNGAGNIEAKELEMFEKTDTDEDFEIPAFLRRQKN